MTMSDSHALRNDTHPVNQSYFRKKLFTSSGKTLFDAPVGRSTTCTKAETACVGARGLGPGDKCVMSCSGEGMGVTVLTVSLAAPAASEQLSVELTTGSIGCTHCLMTLDLHLPSLRRVSPTNASSNDDWVFTAGLDEKRDLSIRALFNASVAAFSAGSAGTSTKTRSLTGPQDSSISDHAYTHVQPVAHKSDDAEYYDPPITVPHLSGIFLTLDNVTSHRDAAGWEADLRKMTALGIRFFCIAGLAIGYEGGGDASAVTSSCPLGRYYTYFTPIGLDPACFQQMGSHAPGGALGVVLRAAEKVGLRVHLGLADPARLYLPWHAAPVNYSLSGYWRSLASMQWAIASTLWTQFGSEHRTTILGFCECWPPLYTARGTIPAPLSVSLIRWSACLPPRISRCAENAADTAIEESNQVGWLNMMRDLSVHYLEALGSDIKTNLSSSLKVWASPYYVGNITRYSRSEIMTPTLYAEVWAQIFVWCPSLDFIAPQDAVSNLLSSVPIPAGRSTSPSAISPRS